MRGWEQMPCATGPTLRPIPHNSTGTCAQTHAHGICAGHPASEEPDHSDHTRAPWPVRASEYAIRAVVRTIPSSTNDAFVRDPRRREEKHARKVRA